MTKINPESHNSQTMRDHVRKRDGAGNLITIFAAICWGFSGTCAQYIFTNFPLSPEHLTAIRMLTAGVLLTIYGFLCDKEKMCAIWRDRKAALRLVAFSLTGIMLCQLSYIKAIAYSNAGTATFLQYTGPVMVMIVNCLTNHRRPAAKELTAILLALLGTFLMATHGNLHTLSITPLALVWGLLSAVMLAANTLLPIKLIPRFGSITINGYGMMIGGLILLFSTQAWEATFTHDLRLYVAFAAIVLFGTIFSFTLYLEGVKRIGPVRGSMIASLEPVAATVFMIVWLHSPFVFMDFLGSLCIFTTVFLLL